MKYLVIPDVHNRIEWAENLITHMGDSVGRIVFLGDYFDSYHDGPTIAAKTAEWLRYSIGKGRIHLMGNHDIPYRWTKYVSPCPGYTGEKHRAISGSGGVGPMGRAEWSEVRITHIITRSGAGARPIVLSHAGFTLANLYGVADFRDVAKGGRLEHLRNRLPQEHLEHIREHAARSVRCAEEIRAGENQHYWFNRGTRTGDRNVGGPFWIDRHQLHSPLPGIDQVVGHTHVRMPQRHCMPHKAAPESEVWFIDGGGRYAAIIDTAVTTPLGGFQVTPIHAQGERIGEPWPAR